MNPTVLLCLDGGDFRVVRELVETGRMPATAALLERSALVHTDTCSRIIEPAAWGPLLSGQPAGDVGFHNFEEFDPATMGTRFQQELVAEPLWLHLPGRGAGTITLDLPDCHPHPASAAAEACCWHAASPAHKPQFTETGLRSRLRSQGRPPQLTTHPPALGPEHERQLGNLLTRSARFRARTIQRVGLSRPLTCVGVHELHAAVHGLGHHGPDRHWFEPERRDPEHLARAYEAIDEVVAAVASQGEAMNVVLVLVRGGRPANHAGQLLEGLLERAGLLARPGANGDGPAAAVPVTERLRSLLPDRQREQLAMRLLPRSVQHRMASRRFRDRYDWQRTRAFPVPSWAEGFVRINLAGREAAGIVPPDEVDGLLNQVSALVRETVDADTGQPLAREIFRARDRFPGANADRFPDLIITWAGERPANEARHPRLGTWSEPPRAKLWTEHRGEAEVIFAGPQIRAGVELSGDELGLAPTVLALLGHKPPSTMSGTPWSDVIAS